MIHNLLNNKESVPIAGMIVHGLKIMGLIVHSADPKLLENESIIN